MEAYENQKIVPVNIETEMKKSYIDYAMSVIVGRALPDVRDGLKPVHRRILYGMYGLGFTPDKQFRKSVATVGEVLRKYHPHGDAAVYDSLVRMAQDFSMRYTLVEGHGNFGSVDGDPAAAMRYTESRLAKISMELLKDIDKDTVEFAPNFDGTEQEPTVLPSRYPNLLVNGSSGIAVGMATNIPPHNLGEVIDGIIKVIDNDDVTIDDLMKVIKGPDFPTGAMILGKEGIRTAYRTGRGRIVIRAKTEIEEWTLNRQKIIVTELPYQVNKARLIEKMAELVRDKKIEGISDLRDESDRDGMRMVIELKRDVNASVILNQLYKNTQLQETFSVIMLALVNNEPKTLNLKQVIDYYLEHQRDVIIRRTKFDLNKAEARAHILEGLKIALDNLDAVIALIRKSKNGAEAKEGLMNTFKLTDIQAQAILDMRLQRLTGLERQKIEEEYKEILAEIVRLKEILASEALIFNIIKEELLEIKRKYADPRRTAISAAAEEIDVEDLIDEENTVITLTHFGYIKRLPVDTYKSQKRGGRGVSGLVTREEDFVEQLFITTTHHFILFFTTHGKVYRLKAYEIPESGRQAKGMAIVNLLQLSPGEKVQAVIPIKEYNEGQYLLMATKQGLIKKTALKEYDSARKTGLQAISIREGDELIDVRLTNGEQEVIIGTRQGMAIRFSEKDVRPTGRVSAGVKGIELDDDDYVIGMEPIINKEEYLLGITQNGFGKRTELSEYKVQTRGGKGVLTYRVTEKTGPLAGIEIVGETGDIMLINSDGIIIRQGVEGISILGRATQGVTLMKFDSEVSLVTIARVPEEEEIEE
ncbi:MAG: DNA gyrase subunit A [Deltaproteobacteria bacterium]